MLTHEVFRALSDAIRRSILEILAGSDRTVRDLASRFEVSRPAISRHLRLLRDAGLVTERRSGRERIHSLEGEALELAASWLLDVSRGRVAARQDPERPLEESEAPSEATAEGPPRADWRQW